MNYIMHNGYNRPIFFKLRDDHHSNTSGHRATVIIPVRKPDSIASTIYYLLPVKNSK